MNKLSKLLIATVLAVSTLPAFIFGLARANKTEAVKATPDETSSIPDGSIARPYQITSYEDLRMMNNTPDDGTPKYYSLANSWIYNEKSNKNTIDIRCPGTDTKKVIWLDLNGKTILREGQSTDTTTFNIFGKVEMYIYDSHHGSGEIQMWLDNYSNDSSLFFLSAGATLNIIGGSFTYLFEYNDSVYGSGSQFSHLGDIFYVQGTAKLNIYDGYFNAADHVIRCETASQVTIYNGELRNLRNYTDAYANRKIISISGEEEKFSNMIGPSTIFSPEVDEWCPDNQLWGAPSFRFSSKNSYLIYTNIPNGSSEITINQGEEYVFTIWRSNAYDFKWSLDNTRITEDNHPAFQLIGDNTLVIKPSLANGLLDNHYVFLSYKFMKNQVFVTRDSDYIGIHVNRTHYVITFDLGGHGDNLYEFTPMSENKTFADVVNSVTKPENDNDYYFLGFAKEKPSYYANIDYFVRAANALKEDTKLIDFDYIFYGAWRSYEDDVDLLTFNQPTIAQINAKTELQSVGKVSFSGLIEKSSYYTQYNRVSLRVTPSTFHAQDDEENTLDFSIYYKIGDADLVKYTVSQNSYIKFYNAGNGVSEEVELFVQINDLSTRNPDKNYVLEFSYKAYIYDSLDEPAKSYTPGQKTNIFILHDDPVPVVLESISLSGTYQTTFRVGDTFSYDGLVVVANYSNETSKEVTSGFTVSTPDLSEVGTKDVEVSYTDAGVTKTTTYQISVVPAETPVLFKSISLSGTYQTEFEVGDAFSYEGLVVTAHYDGKDDEVVTGYIVDSSEVNMDEAGIYTVNVSYTDGEVTNSASYQVTVKAKEEPPVDTSESEPIDVSESEPESPSDSSSEQQPAKKKGCGGSIAATSIILSLLAVSGVALIASKKRKED